MSTHQKFQTFVPGQHFVRGIPFKAHKIDGITPELLEQHYEQVYGGAMRRLNEIETQIASGHQSPALREEQQATASAIILHELHFESLGEDGGDALADGPLKQAIEASFGSIKAWRDEFTSLTNAAKDGWIVLGWSERFDRVMNVHIGSGVQSLPNLAPLVGIDMGNHAYGADFGNNKPAYVAAFLASIHWGHAEERLLKPQATNAKAEQIDSAQISISELKSKLDQSDDVLVLDVRHNDDCERYTHRIADSEWHDSFDVAGWVCDLPKDKPVVVYCMYSFWVSQKVAKELRENGIDARSLMGGVTAWRAMDFPSVSYKA